MIATIKISGQLMGNLIFKQYIFDKSICVEKAVDDDIYITFPTKWQAQQAIKKTFKRFKEEGRPIGGKAGVIYQANKSLSYFKTKAEIIHN